MTFEDEPVEVCRYDLIMSAAPKREQARGGND